MYSLQIYKSSLKDIIPVLMFSKFYQTVKCRIINVSLRRNWECLYKELFYIFLKFPIVLTDSAK